MRVASAVPKVANVARHPRGESYSPCVLICAGGVLPGIIDVDADSVGGSHAFCERIVVRNVCRLVCGTTSNVQLTGPVTATGGCGAVGFGCTVMVPLQVPARKDCGPLGVVGPDGPSPHAANINRK